MKREHGAALAGIPAIVAATLLSGCAGCGGLIEDAALPDASPETAGVDGGAGNATTGLDAGGDSGSLISPEGGGDGMSGPGDASPEAAIAPCGPASTVLDGGCGNPQTDPHNCGACGHDCDGGMCVAGVCAPLPPGVVATGQYGPSAVAIDSENVYWLTAGVLVQGGGHLEPPVYSGSQVLECAIGGCGNRPTVLATISETAASAKALAPASELTIDDQAVYWTDGAGLHACKKGGCDCAPETLAQVSYATAVAVSPANAYFAMYLKDAVDACPLTGCPGGPADLASYSIGASNIVADTNSVYWTAVGGIWQCPLGGCDGGVTNLRKVPGDAINATGVAVDGTNVYWTEVPPAPESPTNGSVYQCAPTGCATTVVMLAAERNQPGPIASDGTNVYWADSAGIVKCAVGGCGGVPTVVAATDASAVAVDATHLAFAEPGDSMTGGQIAVIAK